MKFDFRLALVAAAAALGLQACDVQVHSGGGTTVQQPQASLPENTRLNEQQSAAVTPPADTSAAPAPAAAPAVTAPAETTAQAPASGAPATAPLGDTTAQAPAQPDTSALGAGATPAAAGTAPPAAAATATASAAPTELQKFFETNSPAARADKATAKK